MSLYLNRPDLVPAKKKPGLTRKRILIHLGLSFLLTLAFFGLYYAIWESPLRLPDASMEPTFKKGSVVWLSSVDEDDLKPGLIVAVKPMLPHSQSIVISRIVAMPNQTVRLTDKKLFIHNQLNTKWATFREPTQILPEAVSNRDNMKIQLMAKGQYFLMGDNRDKAYDSRLFGPIRFENIIGVVEPD